MNARGSADEPKGKVAVVKLAQGLHYTDPQGGKVTGSIKVGLHGSAILLKDSAAQASDNGPAEAAEVAPVLGTPHLE